MGQITHINIEHIVVDSNRSYEFATLFAPDVTFHGPILTKPVNGKALELRMRSAPEKPDNKYTMPYAASRFVTP